MTGSHRNPSSMTTSRRLMAYAGAGMSGLAAASWVRGHMQRNNPRGSSTSNRFELPRPLVDAISGAVGEVGQILVLYPVEAIKVRCQRDSIGASEVVSQLAKQAAQPGGRAGVLRLLYSGIGSSALFSIAVGSVHWLSFCTAKRAALDLLPGAPLASNGAGGRGRSTNEAIPCDGTGERQQDIIRNDQARKLSSSASSSSAQAPVQNPVDSTDAAVRQDNDHDLSKRMLANVIAAAFGALATAVIESPVELFRHQAQAGLISGNLIKEMALSVRTSGPTSLWYGFAPFLMEAFPYDVSELGTYSQLKELHTEASKPSSRFSGMLSVMPTSAWDAAIGACAGAAAVMVSMPCDTVKTYLQTHSTGRLNMSSRAQLALFIRTGRILLAERGLPALFVGLTPRLLQQIPSSTICWYSVEACQRALEPWTQGQPVSSPES